MARTIKDPKLDSRSAREKLALNHKPYYCSLDKGCHLGYRKGKSGGTWRARYHLGGDKGYTEHKLGLADDIQDADGLNVLSFSQAQAKAREWFSEVARQQEGIHHVGPYTFHQAAEDYMEWFRTNRKTVYETQRIINKYLLSEFGDTELSKLKARDIKSWLNKLADSSGKLRNGKVRKASQGTPQDEADLVRRRKATANRILTVFKAILNHAYQEEYVKSDDQWKRVKPFPNVDNARVRWLKQDEYERLLNGCEPNLRNLVQAVLLTGCRYGELINLRCEDYLSESTAIFIRDSKSGKPRTIMLNTVGNEFFQRLVLGKKPSDVMLLRANGTPWKTAHQIRPIREVCDAVGLEDVSFHVLRHTYASHLAMNGASLQVIAKQLGHSDTRICEKHYAHLCSTYITETVKEKLPDFGITTDKKVVPLRKSRTVS